MDDLLYQRFPFCLREPPPEGLQSSAYLQFLIGSHKKVLYLGEVERCKLFQADNSDLLVTILLLLLHLLLLL